MTPCQANIFPVHGITCGKPSEYVIHWKGGDRNYCPSHAAKYWDTAEAIGQKLSIELLSPPPIGTGEPR